MKNNECYKAVFEAKINPSNQKNLDLIKNLLKDFIRFGHLLDTLFIDKYAYRFDVAFLFPGGIREREGIADKLCQKINGGQQCNRVFFDAYYKAELARLNLDLYLQTIYRYQTKLIIVFMCDAYERKDWCGLESRVIRDLLKTRQSHRIMLLTVDGHKIDGVLDIDGYLNIEDMMECEVVNHIYSRLKEIDKLQSGNDSPASNYSPHFLYSPSSLTESSIRKPPEIAKAFKDAMCSVLHLPPFSLMIMTIFSLVCSILGSFIGP
ncbi:unnamed protein product [Didymodactylos carnosus]|uniref:TIR domain-containing protein n=1 Tax=Didymodactylos carnosus TaxID=1234261 RepID=A0A8S2ENX2_9BILA|nr:unnamed protein product [Didymodactylos carnosus]CAF4008035.1 unnamed protein product [Didymodactylos carnosus]